MNIIFHHPLPLDYKSKSASGIRPLKMLKAFSDLGYTVDVVSGYTSERLKRMTDIRRKISQGQRYEFIYAESSTQPTTLTDRHHLPLHPWMDASFFFFCKKNNIPAGLFYRDIYWRFDGYGKNLHPIKSIGAKLAYRFDLLTYKHALTKLYLPSMEMGRHVPMVPPELFEALPPGHDQSALINSTLPHSLHEIIRLFYVGGMSNHYQMHKLFAVVNRLQKVRLTVCTREAEWQAVRDQYGKLEPNIRVVHEFGEAMQARLQACDVAILFVKPGEYWEFAAPVKLYEYIGHQKPILASQGTLAGKFVQDNGIGWSLPYEEQALESFLNALIHDTQPMTDVLQTLPLVAQKHSWKARALQVARGLSER